MKWLFCCTLVVLGGSNAINLSQDGGSAEPLWGRASAGLRLAVWATLFDTEGPGPPQLHVGIENVGESDVVLNLGIMLANGKKMYPLAVGLILADSAGRIRVLDYIHPAVAGRVDDYLVALRAGSMYCLRLALDEYCSPSTKEWRLTLPPGSYRVQARFTGWEAKSINLDTPGIALLNFWRGTVQSNVAAFTLR